MKLSKITIFYLNTLIADFVLATVSFLFKVKAASGCENLVPNPLNPNCDSQRNLTAGDLINRFIQIIPFVITLVAVAAIIRGAFKIMVADDAEKRQDGFKIVVNAAIGVALFYSIWFILFLIEYLTGASLINFGTSGTTP